MDAGHIIIFFSHQWTSYTAPDPSNAQFNVMKASLHAISRRNKWPLERMMCWVDYSSVPQRQPAQQSMAIRSLSSYASMAHAFVVIAPEVEHHDSGAPLNIATYRRRMWCRLEQLCHALRNGTGRMWLATSENNLKRLSADADWVKNVLPQNMRVFDGDATKEEDKLDLVPIVLGLYAEMLADAERKDVRPILELIEEEGTEAYFPRTFVPSRPPEARTTRSTEPASHFSSHEVMERKTRTARFEKRFTSVMIASRLHKADAAKPHKARPQELFGGRVERLEQLLEEAPHIQAQLREQIAKRKAATEKLEKTALVKIRRNSSRLNFDGAATSGAHCQPFNAADNADADAPDDADDADDADHADDAGAQPAPAPETNANAGASFASPSASPSAVRSGAPPSSPSPRLSPEQANLIRCRSMIAHQTAVAEQAAAAAAPPPLLPQSDGGGEDDLYALSDDDVNDGDLKEHNGDDSAPAGGQYRDGPISDRWEAVACAVARKDGGGSTTRADMLRMIQAAAELAQEQELRI